MLEAGPAASERKLVTILFADLAGSTELAERLDPERLNVLLEAYFGRMAAVIESWGGTVEKFIGDAVVAVFGVPVVREDDPERAIRAGLEMLTRLEELNDANAARHGVRLILRIGIATGQVIAPAAAQTGQRLIAGDAANVAARLQAAAPPGSILVTERTARAARHAFVFGDATDVVLKGKSQPVRTMTVRGVAQGGPPVRMAPLTGRSAEIGAILGTSQAVVERNEPRCVLIVGPPGIGKSRLTLEAERRLLERHVGAQVLRGRCLALGRGVTYWPLMEMLREAAGIAHDDPAHEAAALLDAHIRAVLAVGGMAAAAIDEASAALAASVGLPVREELLTGLEPREVAERIAEAWTDYASALASRGPTVMVIEDLHWAGGAMIGLLDRLVSDARGPLLVLATARPDAEQALPRAEARGRLVLVSVGALTDDESKGLLAAVLEGEPPGELVRAVLDRAEGNPFFIEEILHHLVDEGLLRRLPTGWTTPAEAELSRLPDSIHAVLTARIDALPPATRRTLHHAAVVGRTFRLDALGALLADDTLERLAVAEARGLVGRVENGEQSGPLEYAFRHALVRDVAYGMLPKAERARSHARYARWLEGDSGDRTDEIVEVLAFHFHAAIAGEDADLAWVDDTGEADDLRKAAFRCLMIAASAARGRFATERAIELHTQALDLSGDDRERVLVLDEIGDDHEVAFQGDESHAARLAAIEIAFREPLLRPLIPAIAAKAARFPFTSRGAFRHRPLPDDLDRLIDAALDHATAGADRATLLSVKAHGRLYRLHLGTDDPLSMDERLGMARVAVDLARRVGDPAAVSRTLRTLAQLLFAAGEYSASVEAVLSLRDLLPTVGSPIEEWPIRFEIARAILDNVGPFGEGLQESDQVWQLLRRMSAHDRLHGLYIMLHSHALTGRWAAIPDLLDQQLALYKQDPGNICPYIQAAPFIGARILAHRGDVAAAEEALASVRASAIAAGTPDAQRARALIALGRAGEGRDIAERILGTRTFWTTEQTPTEIVALIEANGWLPDDEALPALLRVARTTGQGLALVAPGADLAEGRAAARAGDIATAEVLIRRAVDGFSALGAPFETALATEALATTAATAEGRQQMLSEALAIFSELGARPHERRVEMALIAG